MSANEWAGGRWKEGGLGVGDSESDRVSQWRDELWPSSGLS